MQLVEVSLKIDQPKPLKKPRKLSHASGAAAVRLLEKYRGVGRSAGNYKDDDDILRQCLIYRGSIDE